MASPFAMAANIASLRSLLPERAKSTARTVVRTVVEQVERRIADRLRSMLSAFGAGDTRTATTIFYDSEPVAVGLFRAPAVTLTKAALELRGLPAGPPRLPLLPADEGQKERLLADLAAAGMSMVA